MSNRERRAAMDVKGEQRHSKLICQSNKRRTRRRLCDQIWLNSLWGEYFGFFYPSFLNDYIFRADFFFNCHKYSIHLHKSEKNPNIGTFPWTTLLLSVLL